MQNHYTIGGDHRTHKFIVQFEKVCDFHNEYCSILNIARTTALPSKCVGIISLRRRFSSWASSSGGTVVNFAPAHQDRGEK